MARVFTGLTVCLAMSAAACARQGEPLLRPDPSRRPELVRPSLHPPTSRGSYAVDACGRAIRALESGSTLHVGAQALAPTTLYEFRAVLDDGRPVSFARTMTDRAGNIEPFVLWYEAGVVGCTTRRLDRADPARFRFRTFEEAETAHAGRSIVVTAHPVARDSGRIRPAEARAG